MMALPLWITGFGVTGFMMILVQYLFMLFLSAAVVTVISVACGGSNDYGESLQVTSSLMVLLPFSTALGITAAWSILFSQGLFLIVTLYSIYLFYYGLVSALKARESGAKKAVIILVVLALLNFGFTLRHFY